jgi:RNA polymerase primary sigma factor
MSEEEHVLSKYMHDVGDYGLLSPEEEQDLFKQMYAWSRSEGCPEQIAQRGEEAREKLIKCNLRLVIKIAKEFRNIGLDYEDLVNEGNIGLISAIDKFELSKGAKLSYYASFWIKQSIRRAISNKGRTVRLPVALVDLKLKMHRYMEKFESDHSKIPTSEEIANGLNIPLKKVNKLLKINLQAESLNVKIENTEKEKQEALPNEKAPSPYANYAQKNEHEILLGFLNKLNKRQRYIIIRRFGLDGEKPDTLEVIGKRFDLTRERIRQLELAAIQSLKEMYKKTNQELKLRYEV